jgi:hypothetical protein
MLIVDKVLCREIPAPPAEVPPLPIPTPQGSQTNRQRLEQEVAACGSACHQRMDPLGFAYEKYDGIGRVRLTDSGLPIDASGRLPSLYGASLPFTDAIDLAGILASLPAAHRCMGSKWLEYMLGRTLTAAEGPSVTGIHDLFEASNLSLPAVIAAAASSPAFLQPGGGPPCTPGLDQTCNDNPTVSSLRGTCSPAAKCVCRDSVALNSVTGRCQ